MEFSNEAELQAFIHSVVGGRREAPMSNGGRIDILSDKYAIEVKPTLTRKVIHEAMGQLIGYAPDCTGRELVIAGLMPADEKSSISAAKRAELAGYTVWYVDRISTFQDAYSGVRDAEYSESETEYEYPDYHYRDRTDWTVIALLIAGIMTFAGMFSQFSYPEPVSRNIQSVQVTTHKNLVPFSDLPGGKTSGYMPEDTEVTIIDKYRGWTKISYGNSQTAWIESKYLK